MPSSENNKVSINNNYKTAIKRGGPSAPVKWLERKWQSLLSTKTTLKEHGLEGGYRILDYGSGRGEDADYLGAEEYDPHWYPQEPEGKFVLIFCTYVLNVVEREERARILHRLDELAAPSSCIYVTVRRDISIVEPMERDGYKQWYVLDGDMQLAGYRSIHKRKNGWEMYVKKNDL